MSERSLLDRFNRRVPYAARLLLAAALGLSMLPVVQGAQYYGVLLYHGLFQTEAPCSVAKVLRAPARYGEFLRLRDEVGRGAQVVERDAGAGIVRVAAGGTSFWVREAGDQMEGLALIPYLIAEHVWMGRMNPAEAVQQGDTVIDCGAHVGTFTADALARGARRVVAIEPDATNLECLRRNFAREIAEERVVLVPKAVWSEEKMLKFTISDANSGKGSAVLDSGNRQVEVPATTIDTLVRELGIEKVDYIKMDIEGAERHALRGGLGTLTRDRPVLLLESYHLPDDAVVLPRVVRQAHTDYREVCGPCEKPEEDARWRPYALYYR